MPLSAQVGNYYKVPDIGKLAEVIEELNLGNGCH